jgi:hypothetical protein
MEPFPVYKSGNTAVGIRHVDHVALYIRKKKKKLALTSPTSGGRSIGMVRSRTQATEFSFFMDSKFSWRSKWSSSQSSWLQIRRSRVRFPDIKKSSGSGTGSTQPREYTGGATWKQK